MFWRDVQVVKVTPGHESGEVTQPTPQRGDDHWQAEQAELAAGSRRDRGSTTKQQAVYDPESELRYAHIGCMDCYMNRSSEGLRWEDYQDGRWQAEQVEETICSAKPRLDEEDVLDEDGLDARSRRKLEYELRAWGLK